MQLEILDPRATQVRLESISQNRQSNGTDSALGIVFDAIGGGGFGCRESDWSDYFVFSG